MDLADVWSNLNPDVKRAIKASARNTERVRTRSLIGALAKVASNQPTGEFLREVLDQSEAPVECPETVPEETDPIPGEVNLSPCVRETLNFFRLHHIRSVSVAQFVKRLLNIGTGSTVRALEKENVLQELIDKLDVITED